jgi:uncharacterized protein (TIGR02145 family)
MRVYFYKVHRTTRNEEDGRSSEQPEIPQRPTCDPNYTNYDGIMPLPLFPVAPIITLETIKYGALYNWYDIANVARNGFEVPNTNEILTLHNYCLGLGNVNQILKTIGTEEWSNPNSGIDIVGFHMKGAGYRKAEDGSFINLKAESAIRTSSDLANPYSYIYGWFTHNIDTNLYLRAFLYKAGVSIRLIKTTPTAADLLKSDGEACDPYFDGEYYYRTVKIGTQVWVADNIKTRYYADGSPIPIVTDNAAWAALGNPYIETTSGGLGGQTTFGVGAIFNYSQSFTAINLQLRQIVIHTINGASGGTPNFDFRLGVYTCVNGVPVTRLFGSINTVHSVNTSSYIYFDFLNTLVDGQYCFVLEYENVVLHNASNYITIGVRISNPYSGGVFSYNYTGTWVVYGAYDFDFTMHAFAGAMCYYNNDPLNA